MNSLAVRLSNWLSRHYLSRQWMVTRHEVRQQAFHGLRPRILLSRALCLHFSLDFAKVPAGKRKQALQQRLLLTTPFPHSGYYADWQGERAQLWVWDQATLLERLPEAERVGTVPDSALSLAMPLEQGERILEGVHGFEWQRWQNGQLVDSRWLEAAAPETSQTLDLTLRSPLHAADRQQLQYLGFGLAAGLLLCGLLLQAGALLDLYRQQQHLQVQVDQLQESNQLQAQARRRTLQDSQLWQSRQALFSSSQADFLVGLSQALPASAGLWQRYEYQPSRLQILLRDANPDPRDYVQKLGATGLVQDIQVQPEPRNGMLTLQAIPTFGKGRP